MSIFEKDERTPLERNLVYRLRRLRGDAELLPNQIIEAEYKVQGLKSQLTNCNKEIDQIIALYPDIEDLLKPEQNRTPLDTSSRSVRGVI